MKQLAGLIGWIILGFVILNLLVLILPFMAK